ncbi:hypothetical protein PVK06_048597 [Gossypium arboreum]|uniref:Alkyl transferase n=2 Tax=Gossypium arboreum TaxID=29729 RepID=A0ABR0MGW6_GOSAR|nr:hypothetical protein PVK06_048597 [Gossypium arboreum]
METRAWTKSKSKSRKLDCESLFLGESGVDQLVEIIKKCIFCILSVGPIPNHIAFIMDGNRRFTKKCKLMEGAGHKVGFSALMSMLKYCYEFGVRYVTVYAFSIENFKRSPEEVQSLMDLMLEKIEEILKKQSIVNRYGVRVIFSGNLKLLSEPVRLAAERAMLATAKNSKAVLSICVAYTSTNEIMHAVQESCEEKWDEITLLNSSGAGYGLISLGGYEQDEMDHLIKLTDIEKHMYMAAAPDPDIIIRTSGDAVFLEGASNIGMPVMESIEHSLRKSVFTLQSLFLGESGVDQLVEIIKVAGQQLNNATITVAKRSHGKKPKGCFVIISLYNYHDGDEGGRL